MTAPLLRATTRTLPATSTDGTRVKVTLSTGESATYPHNYQLHGPDFHVDCALKLARQSQFTDAEDVKYTITSHNNSGYVISLWPAALEQQ